MAFLASTPTLSKIDLYASSTLVPSGLAIGQLQFGPNGKAFRYVLTGASALVAGNVIQSSAIDTQFTNMGVTPAITSTQVTAGVSSIVITNGTTTVAANQFDGGSMSVYTAGTVAIGDEYTIIAHTTGTSGQALTLTLDRNIRYAFTTSAKVNMRRSPYSGVIQAPATTLTGTIVGVAIYALPLATYGWIQSKGVTAALSDGTSIIVGSAIAGISGTAGAVTLATAGLAPVGYAMQAAASSHAIAVQLQID